MNIDLPLQPHIVQSKMKHKRVGSVGEIRGAYKHMYPWIADLTRRAEGEWRDRDVETWENSVKRLRPWGVVESVDVEWARALLPLSKDDFSPPPSQFKSRRCRSIIQTITLPASSNFPTISAIISPLLCNTLHCHRCL